MRTHFGGAQSAVVLAPASLVRDLLAAARIKIGMVSCRVRIPVRRVTRCYRCLSFGHLSKECKGPDRTTCCRRCGEDGHKAISCSATDTAVKAFSTVTGAVGPKRQ